MSFYNFITDGCMLATRLECFSKAVLAPSLQFYLVTAVPNYGIGIVGNCQCLWRRGAYKRCLQDILNVYQPVNQQCFYRMMHCKAHS